MIVGDGFYRCAKCGEIKPRTAEHFYFDKAGNVTGYCRDFCQQIYLRVYRRTGMSAYQKERRATAKREEKRVKDAIPPEKWRPTRVGVPNPRRRAS